MNDQEPEFKPVKWKIGGNVTSDHVCNNVRLNSALPYKSLDFKKICICASGPSLVRYIEEIRHLQEAGHSVAAMNGSYGFLLSHGIIPDYYFQVDSREGVNLKFLKNLHPATDFIIASQCHPEIFEALQGYDVTLWQVDNYAGEGDEIRKYWPDSKLFPGAPCVGNSCLNPILAMGYRVWDMFGYDGSVEDGRRHAFPQEQNDGEKIHQFRFGDKIHYATGTMAQCSQDFAVRYGLFSDLGIHIILHGDGLTMDMVEHAQAQRLYAEQTAATAHKISPTIGVIPKAKPRRAPMEKMKFVLWKWNGHIDYGFEDVNLLARQIDRWYSAEHEIILMTDRALPDQKDLDPEIMLCEMPYEHFEHGMDWHRLALFSEEWADIVGPVFTQIDLDTLITGPIADLINSDKDAPFKAWRDPNRDQYCTSLMRCDAGAFPHVWKDFDRNHALALRYAGIYGGYDQAWLSYALPGMPRWTKEDGVLSFRNDLLKGYDLDDLQRGPAECEIAPLPKGAKIINFHGKYNPRDEMVQKLIPWVRQYRYCEPGLTEA